MDVAKEDGVDAAKEHRDRWNMDRQKLKHTKRVLKDTTTDVKQEIKEGWYKPFAVIVQDQGYLVDPDGAMEAGKHICEAKQKRGPPYIMYNSESKRIEYLDTKQGVRDFFERSRTDTFSGEVDDSVAS